MAVGTAPGATAEIAAETTDTESVAMAKPAPATLEAKTGATRWRARPARKARWDQTQILYGVAVRGTSPLKRTTPAATNSRPVTAPGTFDAKTARLAAGLAANSEYRPVMQRTGSAPKAATRSRINTLAQHSSRGAQPCGTPPAELEKDSVQLPQIQAASRGFQLTVPPRASRQRISQLAQPIPSREPADAAAAKDIMPAAESAAGPDSSASPTPPQATRERIARLAQPSAKPRTQPGENNSPVAPSEVAQARREHISRLAQPTAKQADRAKPTTSVATVATMSRLLTLSRPRKTLTENIDASPAKPAVEPKRKLTEEEIQRRKDATRAMNGATELTHMAGKARVFMFDAASMSAASAELGLQSVPSTSAAEPDVEAASKPEPADTAVHKIDT